MNQNYAGTAKRTFQHALVHLLETDYGLLGSRRILEMLGEDVCQLVEQFYPPSQRLQSGWMVFTGTKASGPKAYPGQTAAQHELVTLAWPVLTSEDLHSLVQGLNTKAARTQWLRRRLVRLVEYGYEHPDGPVLLTLADLAAMTNANYIRVSKLLQAARDETGKALMTKGYFFDQGVQPTHKAAVIALYEQGLDETEVAYQSQHAQSSVGRYIRDYDRVKLLYKRGLPQDDMPRLLGMRPGVVKAYVELVEKYHPELLELRSEAEPS
ncbi:MAG: DUF1670 domain-containing protein [Gammaproteobacteria bacterium]|nr:DUF1670 domain-containing protein [Gammaproteobacteria bacterium]